MVLMLIPLASAAFVKGETIQLVDFCKSDGAGCTIAVCNKTVFKPDGTLLVYNQGMTPNGSTYTYTLPSSDMLGLYRTTTTCCEGADCGTVEDSFEITYNGGEKTNQLTVVIAAGIMSFLFVLGAIYIKDERHNALKTVLWLFTALLVFLVIPSALLSQTIAFSLFKWGLRASYLLGILILIYITYEVWIIATSWMFGVKKQ